MGFLFVFKQRRKQAWPLEKALTLCLRLVFSALFFVLLSSSTVWAYAPQFDTEERENISVYEQAAQCVVTINALASGRPSSGAGVLIDPSGLVLTSSHVVGDAPSVMISLADGRKIRGVMVGRIGNKADLALIKVSLKGVLPYLKLGDSAQVKVGQKVLAIGNPYGFERTLTTGIISRIDSSRNRLQTDAAINPGNSGGPLLDTHGYVVGINQSIFNPDGNRSNIGIGFAVPVNAVKLFLKKLANQPGLTATLMARTRKSIIRYNTAKPETQQGYENVSMILKRFSQNF